MSLVTLKRNSKRFQVHVSTNGFSLNGGHRNQRAIGDTNLAALYNGHNNICSANDPALVKLSAKNTKGYLYSTVNFPTCPVGVVPPPNNQVNYVKNLSPDDNSQSQHIKDKVKPNAATCVTKKIDSGANSKELCCKARSYHIGGKRYYVTYNAKNSGEYGQGAISAGEYLSAGLLKYRNLPPPVSLDKAPKGYECLVHSPVAQLNSGCYHC